MYQNFMDRLEELAMEIAELRQEMKEQTPFNTDEWPTPRAGAGWTEFESDQLCLEFIKALEGIAKKHGRTFGGIAARLDRLGFFLFEDWRDLCRFRKEKNEINQRLL